MTKVQRAEGQIELNCGADKFFNTWTRETYRLSEMLPDRVSKVELHEGTCWNSVGAVKSWHYVKDGHNESGRTKTAEIDVKNKSVCYNHIDGNLLNYYHNSLTSKMQAIPKGRGCLVKWSFDYEKRSEDAPDADFYIDYLLGCAKDMDAHLCRA